MGAVGIAVLNKLGLKANLEFSSSNAAALAAFRGLNVLVLVVVERVVSVQAAGKSNTSIGVIWLFDLHVFLLLICVFRYPIMKGVRV